MGAFDWIHTSDDIWIRKQEIKGFWREEDSPEGKTGILMGDVKIVTRDSVDDISRKMGLKRLVKPTSSDGFKPDTRFYRMNQVGPSIINKLYEMYGIKTVEELEKRVDEVTETTFRKFIEQFKEIKNNNKYLWLKMKGDFKNL